MISQNSPKKKPIQWLQQGEKIDDFIISQTAKIEMEKITDILVSSLKDELTTILSSSLAPSFEYKHVNEQGLRIWGKAENVAISKATILELLDSLKSVAKNEVDFEKTLFLAGSKSALGFFDQFRIILTSLDDVTKLPSSVVDFLDALGQFDAKSAWWEKIQYIEEKGYIEITIYKPFWRYPWFETSNHFYTSFIAGYILTLHNCCFDYLNIIANQESHTFNEQIGIKIEIYQDPDFLHSHLKLIRYDKYVKDFLTIDDFIDTLVVWLSSNNEFEKNREQIYGNFEKLMKEIKDSLKIKIDDADKTLKEIKENFGKNSPEYLRNVLYKLLNDIRIKYNDLRIEKFSIKP